MNLICLFVGAVPERVSVTAPDLAEASAFRPGEYLWCYRSSQRTHRCWACDLSKSKGPFEVSVSSDLVQAADSLTITFVV